jgi:hypothetical protein
MNYIFLFAEIIPLVLIYVYLAYSDLIISFSTTYLGKLAAIAIIMFYSSIHWIYGLFVCILIILYYQSDLIEGMQTYQVIVPPIAYEDESLYNVEKLEGYNKESQFSFTKDFITIENDAVLLNGKSIINTKLTNQEDITYPKTSDDWVNGIWRSWFIDTYLVPYPVESVSTSKYTNIVS